MDNQEAFDRVVKGIWQQGKQSHICNNGYNECRYRSKDGSKCAFGQLIPDELYDPEMERKSIDNLLRNFPKLNEYLSGIDWLLLNELRGEHDAEYSPEGDFRAEWLARCNYIAKTWRLKPWAPPNPKIDYLKAIKELENAD